MIDPDSTPDDIRFESTVDGYRRRSPERYVDMLAATRAERDHYYSTGEAQPFIDAIKRLEDTA